jgi:putative ABC transport system permease protein
MPFLEAVFLALATLRAQKLKSAFSLVGVFIGVMFLIAVVSIVEGMNKYMTDKFAGTLLGVNTYRLRRRPGFNVGDTPDSVRRSWRSRPQIMYEDADAVVASITVPVHWAWESSNSVPVSYGTKVAKDIELTATTPDYFNIKSFTIAEGRAFTAEENRAGLPVVVLGWELSQKLFGGKDPVGKYVTIHTLPYRVIGVVEKQGNLLGISLDKFAIAPANSPAKRWVNPPFVIDALVVKGDTQEEMRAALAETQAIMRSRRHLRPNQSDNFALETADEVLDFWGKISKVLFLALPMLVGISLVVGGIVIMNIMLMAVAERTREIGLRKSLGATRSDILRQFLVEATTLSTVGAAIGVGTGIGLAFLIARFSPLPASVAPWSIPLGVALGGGVGILAGVIPAGRAARLDPITALRQE